VTTGELRLRFGHTYISEGLSLVAAQVILINSGLSREVKSTLNLAVPESVLEPCHTVTVSHCLNPVTLLTGFSSVTILTNYVD
jgi:hypothetical protein